MFPKVVRNMEGKIILAMPLIGFRPIFISFHIVLGMTKTALDIAGVV